MSGSINETLVTGRCELCGSHSVNAHDKSGVIVCCKCNKRMSDELLDSQSPTWIKFGELKAAKQPPPPTRAAHPAAYIAVTDDGRFDAFVKGKWFRANSRLPEATAFIREHTGRKTGSVPCWDRQRQEWDSEIDIAEGA